MIRSIRNRVAPVDPEQGSEAISLTIESSHAPQGVRPRELAPWGAMNLGRCAGLLAFAGAIGEQQKRVESPTESVTSERQFIECESEAVEMHCFGQ